MKVEGYSLQPTLWRTCRCLANLKRLKILQELLIRPNAPVSQVARNLGMSESAASFSLRALNARGLLSAHRVGKYVFYIVEANLSIPGCFELVAVLRQVFYGEENAAGLIFRQATAFTHPRRLEIVHALRKRPLSVRELCEFTGISRPAMMRHLRKLKGRGFIASRGGKFLLCTPADRFSKALIRLLKKY